MGTGGCVGGGGVGGAVGGGVGGGVGNGVGGTVGVVSGRAVVRRVVAHPVPTVVQQKSFCACDHVVIPRRFSQSYGMDVDRQDKSQQSRGINKRRLKRQQLVIKQVKSLLGRV
jgi:hypothetical protein